MSKHVVLWKFTEKGVGNIQQSPDRAEKFIAAARNVGAKVESMLWTAGPYDGIVVLEAPDDESVSALMLSTAKLGNITTLTMRAFDAGEFRRLVSKVS